MKDYLLISNTKENKISDFYLDFVSSHIEKSSNKTISYRELSYRKAYEWELPSNKYDPTKSISEPIPLKAPPTVPHPINVVSKNIKIMNLIIFLPSLKLLH